MARDVRLLFAWEWGTGMGHLARFEPLARRLIERGVTVMIAARDIAHVRRIFDTGGCYSSLILRQAPSTSFPIDKPIASPGTFPELCWNLGYGCKFRSLGLLESWRGMVEDLRPTCIVADFGIGATLAAKSLAIPVFRIGTGFYAPPRGNLLAPLKGSSSDRTPDPQQRGQLVDQQIGDAMQFITGRRLGLADAIDVDDRSSLLATVKEFDHFERDCEAESYVGIWDRVDGVPVDWHSDSSKKCFAYLNSTRNLTPVFSELLMRGYEIALAGPAATHSIDGIGDIPWLIRCPITVDLAATGPQCQLAMTNGNHGTTLRMLAMGVPVIAIPNYIEQIITADHLNLHDLGASLHRVDPRQSQAIIDKVENASTIAACERFSSKYRRVFEIANDVAFARLQNWIERNH